MVDGPHWERLHLPLTSGDVVQPVQPGGSGEIDTEADTDPAIKTGEAAPELPAPLQNQEPLAVPTPERVQVGTGTDLRDVFEKLGLSDD